ncbi:MAG TPA: chloride channel protein, partial [Phycisphaerales bacterium]|nr:chloride channel protein [Phycisphaerales bacterium]
MLTHSFRRLRRRFTQFSKSEEWTLLSAAAIIGLVMGAVATAFILPIHWMEEHADEVPRNILIWLIPIAPIIGALLTGLVLYAKGDDESHTAPGVSSVMLAVHRKRSRMHWTVAIRKWIASTCTIASGGSAGAEGPIATIGAVIGSNLARLFGSRSEHAATLLGCGAAAGIASVFNAPV